MNLCLSRMYEKTILYIVDSVAAFMNEQLLMTLACEIAPTTKAATTTQPLTTAEATTEPTTSPTTKPTTSPTTKPTTMPTTKQKVYPPGCADEYCLKCKKGYFRLLSIGNGLRCLKKCPPGYYNISSDCIRKFSFHLYAG